MRRFPFWICKRFGNRSVVWKNNGYYNTGSNKERIIFSKDKEYRIPWCAIKRIGKDIILVEADTHAVCVRKN